MKATSDLQKLYIACTRRLLRLKVLVDGKGPPVDAETDRILAFVAIETLALWGGFVRSYYISCSLGARLLNGTRVTTSIAHFLTGSDAIRFAALKIKKNKLGATWHPLQEPTWHQPSTLLRVSQEVGFSHHAQVTAAFSIPTTVFGNLPEIRNFYAHRSQATAARVAAVVSSLGIARPARPSGVMVFYRRGRPQNVIADWIDEVRNVLEFLCH